MALLGFASPVGLPTVSKTRNAYAMSPLRRACSPRMSLAADLAVKAVEAGAAAYIAHSAAPAMKEKNAERKRSRAAEKNVDVKNPADKSNTFEGTDATRTISAGIDAVVEAAKKDRIVGLVVCVLIDLVGSGNLAIPLIGGLLDFATAPLSATILYGIFGDARVSGALLAEELLPGTDIIPTATIAWFLKNYGKSTDEGGTSWQEGLKSVMASGIDLVDKFSSSDSKKR